jgi:voltage-gated potassium channel
MIDAMKNYTIVYGTGLMANAVVERLMRKRLQVAVIDSDNDRLTAMKEKYRRLEVICGRPTDELVLATANVVNARHVVAAPDSDVDILLIGITGKDPRHKISVIAESNDMALANRMQKAGIDEVVSPSQLGGERVTELIMG